MLLPFWANIATDIIIRAAINMNFFILFVDFFEDFRRSLSGGAGFRGKLQPDIHFV